MALGNCKGSSKNNWINSMMTNTAFSQVFSHYDLYEVFSLNVVTNFLVRKSNWILWSEEKLPCSGGLLQNYWRSLEETLKVTLAQYQIVRGLRLSTSKTWLMIAIFWSPIIIYQTDPILSSALHNIVFCSKFN
jgi:hypothetical protein